MERLKRECLQHEKVESALQQVGLEFFVFGFAHIDGL
jgi:hypothetical protein